MKRNFALALCLLAFAAQAQASDLININSADLATLEDLDGIGAAKAQAIIDYRTQNGPFKTTADIMQVSGIGTATYDNIKAFITVSDSGASSPQPQHDASSSTPAQAAQPVGGASPPAITARITTDGAAIVGAGTLFDGAAFGAQGEPLVGARFVWNFGDGAAAEGARVVHTFAYPGTYDVQLAVAYNYSSATARLALDAVPAQVGLVAEGDGSLTLYNYSSSDLDIGWWSLRQATSAGSGQGSSTPFVIPEGTAIIAGKGVRFAPAVLGFVGNEHAALYYPNRTLAAAAAVGAHSPLRGEVVEQPAAMKSAAAGGLRSDSDTTSGDSAADSSSPSVPTVLADNVAAAGAAPEAPIEWIYFLALAGVIAVGVVGAYYAHPRVMQAETFDESDEFEIEE